MITAGRVLSQRLLGTEAVYRVVEDFGDTVLVQVVDAPGLPAGFRMELTADAVRRMDVTAAPGDGTAAAPLRRH